MNHAASSAQFPEHVYRLATDINLLRNASGQPLSTAERDVLSALIDNLIDGWSAAKDLVIGPDGLTLTDALKAVGNGDGPPTSYPMLDQAIAFAAN